MKLIKIYEKLRNQPIGHTQSTDAVVFIGEKKYRIKKIRYGNGKIVGFEVEDTPIIQQSSQGFTQL